MCGLLAYIGKTNQKKFLQGLDLIKHRGPDHTGYQTFEKHGGLKNVDDHLNIIEHRISG